MHSSKYILGFVSILTFVVALVLALMYTGLKDIHDRNEAIFNKKAILSAVERELGEGVKADKLSDQEVLNIFDTKVTQLVVDINGETIESQAVEGIGYKGGMAEHIDMAKEKKKDPSERILPVYIFNTNSGQPIYIISVRGNGLWDEIWGNIALEEDFKTIAGIAFDHKGETPGLGAEIKDNMGFRAQFAGKTIYDENGNFTSVVIRKGGAKNPVNEVDGISGATITLDGVNDMLESGIKLYESYFNTLKRG